MDIEKILQKANWKTENVNALAVEGYEFIISKNYDQAVNCLRIAHELNPKEWYSALMLGIALTSTGKHKEGISYLDIAETLKNDGYNKLHKLIALIAIDENNQAIEIARILQSEVNPVISNFAKGVFSLMGNS